MAGVPSWWDGFVRDVLKRWPGTDHGVVFDMPALQINGHPFVALAGYDIVVRADEFTRARAMHKPMARTFEPEGFKPPKEWVLLTVPSSAAERFSEEWARRAFEYVRTLPPRRIRKSATNAASESKKRTPAKRQATKRKAAKRGPAKRK